MKDLVNKTVLTTMNQLDILLDQDRFKRDVAETKCLEDLKKILIEYGSILIMKE